MQLRRRDFTRCAGLWAASLLVRPSGALADPPADGAALQPVLSWGTSGTGEGQFNIPIAIVISPKDEILITDFRQTNAPKGRLQRFDPAGRLLGSFETEAMPGGLALDKDGLLYATHMMLHKVCVYDPTGKLVREFGKLGTEPGEFSQPGGIAFGPDGSVYVADQVNRRVQRLTSTGEPLGAWGQYGTKPGDFGGNSQANSRGGGPHFLAFNQQGELFTTEASLGRIQKFKADGTFLLAWGDNEIGPGHFGGGNTSLTGPIAIAVDAKNRVWVSATNHHVQQFTADGRYERRIGGEGAQLGQFRLPHGLAFDSQQNLYVVDSRNSRIQKFAV